MTRLRIPAYVVFRELPFCGVLLDTRTARLYRLTRSGSALLRQALDEPRWTGWERSSTARRMIAELDQAGLIEYDMADPLPSLRWLSAHLPELSPRRAGLLPWQLAKPWGELAMTWFRLHRWRTEGNLPEKPFAEQLRVWREFLGRNVLDPAFLGDALSEPGHAVHRIQPYLWLRADGQVTEYGEQVLGRMIEQGFVPNSVGEYYSLWTTGLITRRPDWAAGLSRWLAEWGDDPEAWVRSAYRITHAAFYITDLGEHAAVVEPADWKRLIDLLEWLLDRSVAEAHWDLAAEVLTALACTGLEETTRFQRSTRALLAARLSDGAIPGRDSDPSFRPAFHATLVDVLRCAVVIRRKARPNAMANRRSGQGKRVG